jgi:hypothetical protein
MLSALTCSSVLATAFSALALGGPPAPSGFFRDHAATFDPLVSNHKDGRWRVNDPELSLHPTFGKRAEARANGLMLVAVPEDLFGLAAADLRLELWGGHPLTAGKRFHLNGRGPYPIPGFGTEEDNCTYAYPEISLSLAHLVSGVNALQFACERGRGFWGHFIIDHARVRCFLRPGHPDLGATGVAGFEATVKIEGSAIADRAAVSLAYPPGREAEIESVDYVARFLGFDDDGDGRGDDWHGFTRTGKRLNHVGRAESPPFEVIWDTSMLPTQERAMALQAMVQRTDGLCYATPVCDGLSFPQDRPHVRLVACDALPRPFWSRAGKRQVAAMTLPADLDRVARAQLLVKVWDGGAGTVRDSCTLNGHPYPVISGRAVHDVVFTRAEVDVSHLRPGANEIAVHSDTDHHGIEVLLPGPCLLLRYR